MMAKEKPAAVLEGASGAFIDDLYARFLTDPSAVDPSWQDLFADLGEDLGAVLAATRGASWTPRPPEAPGKGDGEAAAAIDGSEAPEALNKVRASLRALMMIRAYRVRGHLIADLDPLGLEDRDYHAELDFTTYGFDEGDLDRSIFIDSVLGLRHPSLREIVSVLRSTYCSTIGFEFMHIQSPEEKA